MNRLTLTVRILIGMAAGLLVGGMLNLVGFQAGGAIDNYLVNGLFHAGGTIFLDLLKAIVVPVVFVSMKLGKITRKIQIETDLGSGAIAACIASATIVN